MTHAAVAQRVISQLRNQDRSQAGDRGADGRRGIPSHCHRHAFEDVRANDRRVPSDASQGRPTQSSCFPPARGRRRMQQHRNYAAIDCRKPTQSDLACRRAITGSDRSGQIDGRANIRGSGSQGFRTKERGSPASPCKAANRPLCSSDRHLAGLSGRFALADRWAQVQIFSKHRRSGLNVALAARFRPKCTNVSHKRTIL